MKQLGRQTKRIDPRTFKLARYMPVLPPIPTIAGWGQGKKNWGMMLNDIAGDCTIAGGGHLIMTWTMNSGSLVQPTDNEILASYVEITKSPQFPNGFNPQDPNSDTGAVEIDVLNYWRNTGIANHKIDAYAEIDVKSTNLKKNIMASVHLFGGCYTGVSLPNNFEGPLDLQIPWTLDSKYPPKPENGHAMPIIGYDPQYVYYITWGQIQAATWEWFLTCTDEAYAIISKDFFFNGKAPNCFDISTLNSDLKLL